MTSQPAPTPSGKARENLLKVLNHVLEEEVVLSATMRGYLGSITGPKFHSLYRLFGDQCRQIERWLGEITERTRAVGTVARVGADEIVRSARAAVSGAPAVPPRNMVGELLNLHEGIAARLRDDLAACRPDSATMEFLNRLVEFHENTAWMLRMVLHGPNVPVREDQ
ncbi:MAG: ferritin-like domain-containing protein [Opitutaceae bacterium]|nr:ferritin-like domain-containing protein [Opitutaceae bacterium]